MTRSVWVTSLNRLDHQLQQLLVHALNLNIHLVHVPNEKQRQNKNCKTDELEMDEQVCKDERERTRYEIVEPRSATYAGPRFADRNIGRERHCDRNRSLIDCKEDKHEHRKCDRIHLKAVQAYVAPKCMVG